MEISGLPLLSEIDSEIVAAKLGVDGAELHGLLCGYLSAGGESRPHDWLQRIGLEDEATVRSDGHVFSRLYACSRAQLDSPDMGFSLLLPDDGSPVMQRAEALLAWCRGFLGGFGLAPGPRPTLSPESSEALDDMAKIAASNLSYDEPEADENALVEISEFVRVATLLLYSDCNDAPPSHRLH